MIPTSLHISNYVFISLRPLTVGGWATLSLSFHLGVSISLNLVFQINFVIACSSVLKLAL